MVLEDMLFEKFPDGHHHSDHPGYLNENVFSNSESPCCPNVSYQVSVQWFLPSFSTMVREMSFEKFQRPS